MINFELQFTLLFSIFIFYYKIEKQRVNDLDAITLQFP
jgi:hypothetical protein